MSAMTLEAFGLDRLSHDQRVELIGLLQNSMPDDSPLTPAQAEELERRWQYHEANPQDVVPWAEAKARILAGKRAAS